MAGFSFIFCALLALPLWAETSIPSRYTELLDYVQPGPDQGESNTCLFVSSTGAMELIANKKEGIRHPKPYGKYDLSESYLINAPDYPSTALIEYELPVLRFNWGYGIHISEWDYSAWDGNYENQTVWNYRDYKNMKKTPLPKVATVPLFVVGNRWSTNVLDESHITQIKEALWKYKSPVIVNYNDDGYWHVILIVGYDDNLPGTCYDPSVPAHECEKDIGSFYVRDSFGIPVEVRDYDWFKYTGNAAVVVTEAK
jgi:hypothetical protein